MINIQAEDNDTSLRDEGLGEHANLVGYTGLVVKRLGVRRICNPPPTRNIVKYHLRMRE